jgi:ADP-heptose:LPS heptosyltransferase
VGDALSRAGAAVVVTGTRAERPLVEQVCATMRAPAVPVVGALSIGGLGALYERCAVVVSNDTGPLHLAAALDTPVVGLFWVGNMINCAGVYRTRYRPLVSWTLRCPQCGGTADPDVRQDRGGMPSCDHRVTYLTDIGVSEVVEAALDLLAS